MTNKKDLVIAVLATFCLTATLFLIIPTRSQTGQYDPWMDSNDDGAVNILDAINLANVFGTTGDPTKNVNVTNPGFMTIEKDLNMTPNISGTYGNYTDIFNTEGYDRMFVSAAVIDISNHSLGMTDVSLVGCDWCWGPVNGTYMRNSRSSDYSKKFGGFIWDPNALPTTLNFTCEFSIEAPQCSLLFSASPWFGNGWILIRISIYLTAGTTSPQNIQKTYVTNMPNQLEPAFSNQERRINASIMNGYGGDSADFYLGGYSRMFVSLRLTNASYQGVPVTTTVSLSSIYWEPNGGWQSVPVGILNATYYGISLPSYNQQVPAELDTRGSSCWIYFSITSGAVSGWIEFEVTVYLRNE